MAKTNEAGAIWTKTDKKGAAFLSILLNGRHLNGFLPKEKKTETSPDFNLVEFDASGDSKLVGAAWNGKTKQNREKLTLKVDGIYFTAVKRDQKEGAAEGRADYTIFDKDDEAPKPE